MNFATYESPETYESPAYYGFEPSSTKMNFSQKNDPVKLFTDKFIVPPLTNELPRPRLIEHTQKLLAQFSATTVTGRAGTGKSVLAAQFAAQSEADICWYKVETADGDWKIFASYLLGSLNRVRTADFSMKFDKAEAATQSENIAARFVEAAEEKPLLLVLDDLHSVFDAEWFSDFFNGFVPSLSPNINLLLVARTLPPLPLWRLRSKQILGVVEEKLLTFTLEETVKFFHKYNLDPKNARIAHQVAYGKISKLKEIAEKKALS
jgi:LuxR family transcriptional regulator, maltose regulon positive regulatory protein